MTPLPADKALDAYFHDARSKLLDVAAVLDRIGRGMGAETTASDPRMARLRQALEAILAEPAGRAERVQQVFSLDYDPEWPRPTPR